MIRRTGPWPNGCQVVQVAAVFALRWRKTIVLWARKLNVVATAWEITPARLICQGLSGNAWVKKPRSVRGSAAGFELKRPPGQRFRTSGERERTGLILAGLAGLVTG